MKTNSKSSNDLDWSKEYIMLSVMIVMMLCYGFYSLGVRNGLQKCIDNNEALIECINSK